MKRVAATLTLTLLLSSAALAQLDSSLFHSWSVSLTAHEYGYDTGLGVDMSSPGFFNGSLCFRLKASTAWMESYMATYDRWARYQLIEVMAVYQFKPVDRARPYLEAGLIEVFPSRKFSDVGATHGFGARVGIELFAFSNRRTHLACFFEGGINHARAVAEKIESQPTYVNGFAFATGVRFFVSDLWFDD